MRAPASILLLSAFLTGGQSASTSSAACNQTISAANAAHFLPAHVSWERYFDAAAASRFATLSADVGVPLNEGNPIVTRISTARGNVDRIRKTAAVAREADLRAADVILDARDDLIRLLDPAAYERLEAIVRADRQSTFATPSIGIRSAGRCVVIARGSEYPELIPEIDYWKLYFYSRAQASSKYRHGASYDADHIRAVRTDMAIPAEYVTRLLNLAADVVQQLESLPDTAANSDLTAQIILNARAQLIRSMPEIVWLEVRRDADRTRSNMVTAFPSDSR